MINLLPEEYKKELHSSHVNTILIKYLFSLVISIVFLLSASALTYWALNTTKAANESNIPSNQVANGDNYKIQFENIKLSIGNAQSVLGKQVSFTDILIGVAKALPKGTKLESFSLESNKVYSAPVQFKMQASKTADNNAITNGTGFNDDQGLFSNYSVISRTPNSDGSTTVTFSVMIKRSQI